MKTTSINFQLPEAWPWHERYGTRRAAFHTLFTADAIIGISDDNVFVPQETDFANNIARAVVDTFPAGSTRSGVHPYVWSMDTL